MNRYKIPDLFLPGIKILATLDKNQLSSIIKIVDSATVGDNYDQFASKIFENKSINLSQAESESLAKAVFSLIILKLTVAEKDKDYLKDISYSYSNSLPAEARDNQFNSLFSNLTEILNKTSVFETTVKAHTLAIESERSYSQSRVFTDIRLIFNNEDINSKTKAAILLHNLKIAYRESGEENEIFYTLTTEDLIDLKNTLERAIEKSKLIQEDGFSNDISFIKTNKEII